MKPVETNALNGGRLKAMAALRGVSFTCLDATVQKSAEAPWNVDRILVEYRDYTATLRAVELVPRTQRRYPGKPIFAIGPYAEFNAAHLQAKYGVEVVQGSPVQVLDHVFGQTLNRDKRDWPDVVPDRSDFRSLRQYPKLRMPRLANLDAFDSAGWVEKVSGNIEFSNGCLYKCLYYSVAAKYDGEQTEYPQAAILADIDQLVAGGAEHIAITDADAFGRPSHAIALLRLAHTKYPDLTFDAVTRVDHIRKIRNSLLELRDLGLVKLTSSFEFPDDRVLRAVNKEFAAADIPNAIRWCREANIALAPTFIPFNPWVGATDVEELPKFLACYGLESTTDQSQLATRLLLYKGSPLLRSPAITTLGLKFTEQEFHVDWAHLDPRVDDLYHAALAKCGAGGKCCIRC